MADIRVQDVYDQLQNDFSARGQGQTRFQSDFIQSCNDAINEINVECDLQSEASLIASLEDTITGLDVKYQGGFGYLVARHLITRGRRPAQGSDDTLKQYWLEGEKLKQQIYFDLFNASSAADDDNDTTDIIGMGAVG